MIRLNRLPALAFVLAGSLAIPAGVASAQSNSAYRSADAVVGKAERLGVYGNVQKDCTSGPLPTVRVVTPPKHGELNVRSGTLKVGRITRCSKLAPSAQGISTRQTPATRDPTRSAMRSGLPAGRSRPIPSGLR